jgi:2-polyprenyl-3-methyl-5-hydroxy-6-metoxy-1,4-benzoquinol methylase
MNERSENEIRHGIKLASSNPELVWGWGSKAGKLRAKHRADLICEGALLQPGVKALEIGCGTGLFTQFLAETGAHITAVDISPELLEIARNRKLPEARITFLEKRFEECDVEGPFNAVVGSSVLHHLEITKAMQKIFSLLKPGGVMSFAEPNMLNPQIMVQKNIPWIKEKMGDSPDETAFIRWSLKSLLNKVGFERIEIIPFDWLHPAVPERAIPAVIRIGKVLEQLPVIKEFAGSLYIRAYRPE